MKRKKPKSNLINGQRPEFGNPEHLKWIKEQELLNEIGHTPDEQMMYIVRGFSKEIIDGMGGGNSFGTCLLVCDPLSGYLEFCGFPNKIVECEVDCGEHVTQHFYLELPDGRIIDPTADQFSNPKTGKQMPRYYFGAKPEWYKKPKLINAPALTVSSN